VRFLLHDTDVAAAQVQDEEISWALVQSADTYSAAAMCADSVAAHYASESSKSRTVGDLSLSESRADRAAAWRATADRLRLQAFRMGGPMPSAGGIASPFQFAIGDEDNPSSTDPQIPRWASRGEAGA
jgi:hypothetical protein